MKRFSFFAFLTVTAIVMVACSFTVNLGNPTPAAPSPQNPLSTSVAETSTPLPQPTAVIVIPTSAPKGTEIIVYFMDENRFLAATDPYEVAVTRTTDSEYLPLAVLDAYFAGPTQAEYDQGLRLLSSGFTQVRKLTIENGIARVYLGGVCANNGAAYSVAAPLMRNLMQFPEVTIVKIYDENDSNLDPDSSFSSLPYCLEP